MLNLSITTFGGLFFAGYLLTAYMRSQRSPLNRIPTIGPSGLVTSYYGFVKSLFYSREMLKEGYEKYYGGSFKIAMPTHWMVMVTGPKLTDELRRAPEDQLSSIDAIGEGIQVDYTLGKEFRENNYHISSVRTMSRHLDAMFPDMQDEIAATFSELVPAKEGEWLSVPANNIIAQAVCRANNRLFVGLPFCRDSEYLYLNINYTMTAVKTGHLLAHIPVFLRPAVSRILNSAESSKQLAVRLLGPMIQDRLEKFERHGSMNYPDRPNDFITFLLEHSEPRHRTVRDMATRILIINFVAIYTTVMAMTHILYDLASRPEYAEPMRQEIISIIQDEGWSKSSIGKMHKVDSFVHESQRLSPPNMIALLRRAVKDYTFSDGTTIPAGQYVCATAHMIHTDQDNYSNPEKFEGFRFADLRDGDRESSRHQATSVGLDYLIFGGGYHTCPGRFSAVLLMKTMLCHILLNYDVKVVEGSPPKTWSLGVLVMPDHNAHVLFRRRNFFNAMVREQHELSAFVFLHVRYII
ncbi:cytochrome P450 [Pluteus cervinus]|uniref:Cytochrome P450 n=1 Tax=Pluteus cervinus TaxID=181527 RepID=A0ACD3AMD1_9AGAR|nr:cytochrome P450 [Pluteus cervinus]